MWRNKLKKRLEIRKELVEKLAAGEIAVDGFNFVMPTYESMGLLHDDNLICSASRDCAECEYATELLTQLLTIDMMPETRTAVKQLLENIDGLSPATYEVICNCALLSIHSQHKLHRQLGEFVFTYGHTNPMAFLLIRRRYYRVLHVCPGQGKYHPFMSILYNFMEVPLPELYQLYCQQVAKFNAAMSYPDIQHLVNKYCPKQGVAPPGYYPSLFCKADPANNIYYIHANVSAYDMDNAREVLFMHAPAVAAVYNQFSAFDKNPQIQAIVMEAVRYHGAYLIYSLL